MKKRLALILVAAVISVSSGFYWMHVRNAEAFPSVLFGGISIIDTFCLDGSIVVNVIGPRPIPLLKVWPMSPTTFLYRNFAGTWVLGNAVPGGWCPTPKGGFPVTATAVLTGTSLL